MRFFLLKKFDNYPKVKSLRKNAYYAGLLQNLLCGEEGVVIFFLQLKYQKAILGDFYPQISQTISEILEIETIHHDLLSNAIIMSGGDPMLITSQGKWLVGRQIDYIKELKQIISYNIEVKEKSVIDFKLAHSKIDNIEIKNLLREMIRDEEIILKKLKSYA